MSVTSGEKPWYANYPEARHQKPASISRTELLDLLNSSKVAGRDYALIDVRRTDFEGGTIVGAINLPAQSLYPTIPTLFNLFKAAGVSQVIWWCGSSRGRGSRAACWFADYIEDQGDVTMQSLVLAEGIKGWATAGPEYTEKMVEYEAQIWGK